MKPAVIFIFHFNQAVTPYAKIADEVCYKGLLQVLRKHKDAARFSIHISGTLIDSLREYKSKTIDMIKQGISDGQFEIIGSTYAQNVMYSTDDISNQIQIELHRKILKEVFDASPSGFWIPERCWRTGMKNLLVKNGYKYAFIEKEILKNNGIPQPDSLLRNGGLIVFPDDEMFRHQVNLAIWSGIKESVLKYLDAPRPLAVYAEDAEAAGLWGYERGTHPKPVLRNLDGLISELKQKYEFKTGLQILKSPYTIIPQFSNLSKDGQAGWMVRSARVKEAPYHEDGFCDWFDFNLRSKKIRKYRKLFEKTAKKIKKYEKKIPGTKPARKLLEYSKKIFASHQFEFGCIGIGEKAYLPFSGVRNSLIPLKSLFVKDGRYIDDINEDGVEEIVIKQKKDFYVFSKYGGRLLYWYDLKNGCEIVGSSVVSRNPKNSENDNLYVPPGKIKKVPDCIYENDIEKYKKEIRAEQSWFKWHIAGVPLTGKNIFQYECASSSSTEEYFPPQRCFNDFASDGAVNYLEPNFIYKYDREKMTFEFESAAVGLKLEKQILLKKNGISILYKISASRKLSFKIINGYNSGVDLKISSGCRCKKTKIRSLKENINIFEPALKTPLQKFYISMTKF